MQFTVRRVQMRWDTTEPSTCERRAGTLELTLVETRIKIFHLAGIKSQAADVFSRLEIVKVDTTAVDDSASVLIILKVDKTNVQEIKFDMAEQPQIWPGS